MVTPSITPFVYNRVSPRDVDVLEVDNMRVSEIVVGKPGNR